MIHRPIYGTKGEQVKYLILIAAYDSIRNGVYTSNREAPEGKKKCVGTVSSELRCHECRTSMTTTSVDTNVHGKVRNT